MKIVLAGPKGAGKSSIGRLLAERLSIPFVETDEIVTELSSEKHNAPLTPREIVADLGEPEFKELERLAAEKAAERDWCLISTGGSTLLDPDARRMLRRDAIIVLLHADPRELWKRISADGIPAFLVDEDDPETAFVQRTEEIYAIKEPYADIVIDNGGMSLDEVVDELVVRLSEEMTLRAGRMSTLGEVFRISTFGESHGPALGAVIDGVPPNVELSESDIQAELDRRRPGQSAVSTARKESDRVEILSGVFEGKTTGAPVALLIRNKDQKSSHYESFKHLFRPGHADFTFWAKYGRRDHRGGGRSSGRETAARTAGGAIAKKILTERGICIRGYALEIAGIRAETIDLEEIEKNPVRTPDATAAEKMAAAIMAAKEDGDSVGGIVQIEVNGVPAGLGDPVFGKLDARLGGALFSLGTVKGVEIGDGFSVVRRKGSENNDAMRNGQFVTNHAGGILGGISTGAPVVVRIAVKPTPSINRAQETSGIDGQNESLRVEGRHDPCVVPRVVPVAESMVALVILDLLMIQERLQGVGGQT